MMTKIQLLIKGSLFVLMITSCSSRNDVKSSNEGFSYEKLERLIEIYDSKRDIENFRKNESYPIADSLSLMFQEAEADILLNDTAFIILGGKLLEKKYLATREMADDPEAFYVYNLPIWTTQRDATQFIFNVIRNIENQEKSYNQYVSLTTDFYCVDSLINVLNGYQDNKEDSTHILCLSLLKENKTGDCSW